MERLTSFHRQEVSFDKGCASELRALRSTLATTGACGGVGRYIDAYRSGVRVGVPVVVVGCRTYDPPRRLTHLKVEEHSLE